ncbi:MAG: response regulator [Clostridia bacterium]|nr:response regulator [Clostridia bacterium]
MKIIVVDDESDALHIVFDEVISRKDTEYKFFKDKPEDILEYVAANVVDGAFLDIKMPEIDGTVLAEKLIKIRPDIKIVFITGLNVNKNDLPEQIKANTLGFIYKPYDKNELINYLNLLSDEAARLDVVMFDTFECTLGGRHLEFSSGKSRELFALLLVYGGKTLSMSDAIAHLWPDHDTEKAKILYRDAVWRLRKTLQNVNFNCIGFNYGELTLDRQNINCDFWNMLEGKKGNYRGDFLKNYDWSTAYLAKLDKLD